MDLYEEVSYQGTAQVLAEHDVATLRTPLGQWAAQSAKMNGLRLLSYTEYDPNDVSTDYRLYRDSYRVEDVPDLSVDYQAASLYIRGTALGENDVVVRVRLTPDDTTQRVVMSAFQRFPQLSGYATASLTVNGVAEEGVLVVFDKTQPVTTVAVQAGVLNEDGTADWQVNTTVRAVWSESRQEPLLTLDDNAPADWQFLSMQATGNAGEFTTLLTGAFPGSLHIESLTSDKASIADNGTDVATLTALVLDAQEVATEGVTVHWNTTSGILNVASSTTNVEGQASAQLSSTEDGTAVVTAQILGQDSKEITIQVTSQSLVVMGARSSNRSYGEYILSRLVAMDPVTSSPVIASWQYTDDMETYSGSSFTDIYPERELTVSAAGYLSVGLNVSNILGSGGWYDDDPGSSAAFSARKNDATVVAWGSPERGGVNPAGTDNKNVQGMCATASAFAAIRSDGSAFAWGNEDRGGVIPLNISERFDIVDLRSNRGTFLLRATSSPYIQTWGLGSTVVDDEFPDLDLSVPSNIAAMNDIVQLQMTEFAAAVVNSVGQVFAFGDASSGGAPDTTITGLSGITSCYSTLDAFAVLHGSGQIAAWGNENGGGDARVVMGYTDVMRLCGTQSAFLGLRKTGEIIAWGNSDEGGAIPAEYLELSNAVDIKSTYSAFAVLRSDGTVVCWGDEAHGGVTPSVNNVIAITGTSYSFAALRSDGTVYTWGDAVYGGDSSSVSASLKNVKAIYSNSRAFIALKNDNTVIVWGDTESGGSQGDVPATLNGYISYSF
ncbi:MULTISPECIES: Ig-like domain-containing protein [Enterobacterales]|uniref:Ig-like domain-containing protein n=1 Tax=Enterobacterales TaxID=91347 RepID=UPI002EDAB471